MADAIKDPVCRSAVEEFWNDAEAALPAGLGVPAYRAALLSRFANPRIEHLLSQIAQDSSTKVRLRVAPVAEVALANGRDARGCALAVASWILAQATGLIPGASAEHVAHESVASSIGQLGAVLGADRGFVSQVLELATTVLSPRSVEISEPI